MSQQELRIKLFSYDATLLDNEVKKLVEILRSSNTTYGGPIPLPTKREIFTVIRSPHIWKKSREQFERITHYRLIVIKGVNHNIIQKLSKINLPSGVAVRISNPNQQTKH